jgi:hypothetical protein
MEESVSPETVIGHSWWWGTRLKSRNQRKRARARLPHTASFDIDVHPRGVMCGRARPSKIAGILEPTDSEVA